MNTIKVPYKGKGHTVSYKLETIDLSMTDIPFINVYSVFIDDPELQEIIGDHFTMLHNINQNVLPAFAINQAGNIEEMNLKKTIAQQIMNNPNK
jgi:hypothetical protein